MALPDSNISVAMVRKELGAATNDVGRLCIHPNVNMMAINKPTNIQKLKLILGKQEALPRFYNGVENYGIRKPHNVAPGNATKIGQAQYIQ